MPWKRIGSCSEHIYGCSRTSRWITHCNEMAHAYIEFVIDEFPPGFVLGINKYRDRCHYLHDSYTKQRTYTMVELYWDENGDPCFSEEWVTAFASNCEVLLERFATAMENISPQEVVEYLDHDYWISNRNLFEK